MSSAVFAGPEAKARLIEWHHRFRGRIGRSTESRQVTTRFGPTHVLLCGPEDAPPLVLVHSAMASSAHALHEVATLADRYRVVAPDVIGQSPLSAEVRPDVNGPAYGEWLLDVLDAPDLPTAGGAAVRLLGVSWGGFVALRAAALAPDRVCRLSLIVPAALVQGGGGEALTKLALPMLLYRAFPTPGNLERFASALFTTLDPEWVAYIGDAFRGYRLDFRPPRPVRDGELAALSAPVQVFGAERDLSFPGAALLERAKAVFPNLAHAELLPGARHAPSFAPDARLRLAATIAAFMA